MERETASISDHFFTIVKIGGRWIRVDTNAIGAGVILDDGPYVKLMNLHDQADVSREYWDYQRYWNERPYTYVTIEEKKGHNRR
jgi:hypothetical protein